MMNSTEALDLSESSVSEETGTGTGTSISQEISQVFDKIAEKETKQVFFLRLLVLVFLMATAMAVSVAVFAVTFNGDEANFKEHYEKAAQSILENVSQLTFDFGAITTMGISSQSNGRFAFVPNFRQRATTARSHLAGALSISIAPMILLDEIEAWDSFVNDPENGNWM